MSRADETQRWLQVNGYEWVAELIAGILADWKVRKVKTRRNWWLAIAGTEKGRPATVNGVAFPIIAAARVRQGFLPVEGALRNSPEESAPPILPEARWLGHQKVPKQRKARKKKV